MLLAFLHRLAFVSHELKSPIRIAYRPPDALSLPLSDRCDGGNRGVLHVAEVNLGGDLPIGVLLRAVARNVTSLTTLVARLASGVQGATVRSSAVTGNVTKLATGVTFHGLSLAISGKMVGATTLVACSRARASSEASATEAASESTTTHGTTTTHSASRVGASPLKFVRIEKN